VTDSRIEHPNTTQIPNSVIDAMSGMSDQELRVVLSVMRHTFGFGEASHPLSVRYLASYTGIGQNSVMDGAAEAIKHGFIKKVPQLDAKKYNPTVYAPAFKVPPVERQGASHSEASASQPEAGGASGSEASASQPEAKTTLSIKTTTTTSPAAELFEILTGISPNPAQSADLAKLDSHPHLSAVMHWAAQEGVTSSRKIVAAARRWDPNPKKEKPANGNRNNGQRPPARKPDVRPTPQGNRPTPERFAKDRELAEERRRKKLGLAN
jgi:hypothetical protein